MREPVRDGVLEAAVAAAALAAAAAGGSMASGRGASRDERLPAVPVRLPALLPEPALLEQAVPPLEDPESVAQSSRRSPDHDWLFCSSSEPWWLPWWLPPWLPPRPSRMEGDELMEKESGVWSWVYFHEDDLLTPTPYWNCCCPPPSPPPPPMARGADLGPMGMGGVPRWEALRAATTGLGATGASPSSAWGRFVDPPEPPRSSLENSLLFFISKELHDRSVW